MCNYGFMTVLPLGQARNHFSEVVDEVERTHDRVTITRHGQPVAVIMAAEDLAALEETLAVLSTPGEREAIEAGVDDIENGRVESWEDMRAEFGRLGSGQ
jgi:antitoxin YefM